MTGQQLSIFDAIAARDAGMNRVAAKTEELNAGWQDLAIAFIRQYAMSHQAFFTFEVRHAFEAAGLMKPHKNRSWGPAMMRAAKDGLIRRSKEFVNHPDPNCHAVPVKGWYSNVHKRAA